MQNYTGKSFGPESHAVAGVLIHQSHSGRSIDPKVTVALEIHTQSHWGRSHDPESPGQESWPRVTEVMATHSGRCCGPESQLKSCKSYGVLIAGGDRPAEHTLWQASIVAGWLSMWNCGRLALWQTGRAGWLCIRCGRPALWQTGQAWQEGRFMTGRPSIHLGSGSWQASRAYVVHGREGSIMTGWPSIQLDRQAGLCRGREGSIVAGRTNGWCHHGRPRHQIMRTQPTLAQHDPQLTLSTKSFLRPSRISSSTHTSNDLP